MSARTFSKGHDSRQACCFSRPGGADEILRERLEDAVTDFNATTDPDERVTLHHEIVRLRGLLGGKGQP